MLQILALTAMLSTAAFAGAALRLAFVEYPARSRRGINAALLQWIHDSSRAPLPQTPLATIGCVTGTLTSAAGGGVVWTIAAALIGLAVLLSVVVMPKPRLLFGPNRESESAATRELLHEWAVLHRARTALSVLAAVLMIWKFSQIA